MFVYIYIYIYRVFAIGPTRRSHTFVVFEPNTSCGNELHVPRTCTDTYIASTPMYISIALYLIGYCGCEAVDKLQ